jgi:hypothetical protein
MLKPSRPRDIKKCLNCGRLHQHNNSFCSSQCCQNWRKQKQLPKEVAVGLKDSVNLAFEDLDNPDMEVELGHFAYQLVPEGSWSRIKGDIGPPTPSPSEARPHFIALTPEAKKFVHLDTSGVLGSSGLCPGEVLHRGEWVEAYRFVNIKSSVITTLLKDLNTLLEQVMTSADIIYVNPDRPSE